MHWRTEGAVRVLGREECLARLAEGRLGSVGVTLDALPSVLPVVYHLRDGEVVVRAGASSLLARAMADRVVSLLVHDIDPRECTGWAVTVTGLATTIDDPGEQAACADLPLPTVAPDDVLLRVATHLVRGRQTTAEVAAGG